MKILYFDTETTGTDPSVHEITQFAAIVEIDGKVIEEVNWKCQPKDWDNIEPMALQTTGVGIDELKTFQEPEKMYEDILKLFKKYGSKYDKGPLKFYPAGHNVSFDLDFLNAFFKKYGDADTKKWGITSWQNWRALDSRIFANFLFAVGKLDTVNVKLSTLCEHYGIEIDAHDALSDIRATRSLVQRMMEELDVTKTSQKEEKVAEEDDLPF